MGCCEYPLPRRVRRLTHVDTNVYARFIYDCGRKTAKRKNLFRPVVA